MKNWKFICTIVMVAAVLYGCVRCPVDPDPRVAFVGDYSYVSTGGVDMEIIYDYGEATLINNQLDWQVEVSIKATYLGAVLSGSGPIEIVATKKSSSPI